MAEKLALANRAPGHASQLLELERVRTSVRVGGHNPVVVKMRQRKIKFYSFISRHFFLCFGALGL